jgi:hypothetical protein
LFLLYQQWEVMNMKRFLILFIAIVFVTVCCAGPNKVGGAKPDFRRDQLEKDREDCIQAVKDDPGQNMSVEECLTEKGYEFEPEDPSDEGKSKTAEVAKTAGKVLLGTALVAVAVAALVAFVVLSVLAGV